MSPEIRQIIQQSLDLIESSLRSPISAQALADAAGFSLSHYYHVFEAAMGMSVGRYVTYRRLLHAAWDIHHGKDALTTALDYGFDTHAGFYKAFRKEFGCAPSRHKHTRRAARPARVNLKEVIPLTDTKLIVQALRAWGLEHETVSPIYYANTGHRSDHTFAVGQDYCIKACSQPGELARQASLHRALMAQQLSADIVPTLTGTDILHTDGMDFLLMHRAQGKPVDAVAMMEHPQHARAIGEGLARLHTALRSCDPVLCVTEDYTATMRDWAIPALRASVMPVPAWLDDFQARMESTFPSLPTQIIHRDPNPDNLLMEDGKVTGFLDFDLTRILPRIFDLCYAATGILSSTFFHVSSQQQTHFFAMAKAIWQGYDAVSPLTEAEWRALPDMVLAIQLTCVAAFAGSDKYAQQFEVNQAMLNFILQHFDQF